MERDADGLVGQVEAGDEAAEEPQLADVEELLPSTQYQQRQEPREQRPVRREPHRQPLSYLLAEPQPEPGRRSPVPVAEVEVGLQAPTVVEEVPDLVVEEPLGPRVVPRVLKNDLAALEPVVKGSCLFLPPLPHPPTLSPPTSPQSVRLGFRSLGRWEVGGLWTMRGPRASEEAFLSLLKIERY